MQTTPAPASPASVSLYDARPFFEKALQFGVQNGLIDPHKLETICTEAPKGMVQIARYFGNEFLRPDIEQAKGRIVNLVSLYLENTSGGDLQRAAESLRVAELLPVAESLRIAKGLSFLERIEREDASKCSILSIFLNSFGATTGARPTHPSGRRRRTHGPHILQDDGEPTAWPSFGTTTGPLATGGSDDG